MSTLQLIEGGQLALRHKLPDSFAIKPTTEYSYSLPIYALTQVWAYPLRPLSWDLFGSFHHQMWNNFLLEELWKSVGGLFLLPHCKAIAFQPEVKQGTISKSIPLQPGFKQHPETHGPFSARKSPGTRLRLSNLCEKAVTVTTLQNSYCSNGAYNWERQEK